MLAADVARQAVDAVVGADGPRLGRERRPHVDVGAPPRQVVVGEEVVPVPERIGEVRRRPAGGALAEVACRREDLRVGVGVACAPRVKSARASAECATRGSAGCRWSQLWLAIAEQAAVDRPGPPRVVERAGDEIGVLPVEGRLGDLARLRRRDHEARRRQLRLPPAGGGRAEVAHRPDEAALEPQNRMDEVVEVEHRPVVEGQRQQRLGGMSRRRANRRPCRDQRVDDPLQRDDPPAGGGDRRKIHRQRQVVVLGVVRRQHVVRVVGEHDGLHRDRRSAAMAIACS